MPPSLLWSSVEQCSKQSRHHRTRIQMILLTLTPPIRIRLPQAGVPLLTPVGVGDVGALLSPAPLLVVGRARTQSPGQGHLLGHLQGAAKLTLVEGVVTLDPPLVVAARTGACLHPDTVTGTCPLMSAPREIFPPAALVRLLPAVLQSKPLMVREAAHQAAKVVNRHLRSAKGLARHHLT